MFAPFKQSTHDFTSRPFGDVCIPVQTNSLASLYKLTQQLVHSFIDFINLLCMCLLFMRQFRLITIK